MLIAVGIGVAVSLIPFFLPLAGADLLYAPARFAISVLGEHHGGDIPFPSALEIVVGCGANVLAWAGFSYGVFLLGSFIGQ